MRVIGLPLLGIGIAAGLAAAFFGVTAIPFALFSSDPVASFLNSVFLAFVATAIGALAGVPGATIVFRDRR